MDEENLPLLTRPSGKPMHPTVEHHHRNRWLRSWLEPGLDADAQRARMGRLAGGLYLAACVYAGFIIWHTPEARLSQGLLVALVTVFALTLFVLPWQRFPDSALIWPVLPSALLTTVGEGAFGVLGHYQPLYVLALGYAGLVLRPGLTTVLAAFDLVLLGLVAVVGLQRDHLIELAGTIACSALIGELISAASAVQQRQRTDLERLHAGLRPLLSAQSVPEAARLVAELAADLLRADGVVTMVTDTVPEATDRGSRSSSMIIDPPGPVASAQAGAGAGAQSADIRIDLTSEQSGLGVVARTRRHLFVPDAPNSPLVSPEHVARFGCASTLFVPITVGERLIGVLVVWWTTPIDDLDHFSDQVVELLSLQAGPVLERVRQVEDLDRAATTDGLTGVLNRRAFEHALTNLDDDAVLLLFDLDKFKQLNDTQGHPAGDRVLRAFAAALAASVRDTDRVCRIGGDEFAVLVRGDGTVAESVLTRLATAWTEPEGVGFSAGFAVRHLGEAAERLNARADEALYLEKNRRRERDGIRRTRRP